MRTSSRTLYKGKWRARLLGIKKDELIARYNGRDRLRTVERFNLRQIEMETGYQVRKHVRNVLETAGDKRRRMTLCGNAAH